MPGNEGAPNEGDRLKILAENAGIPELQAFEEDSGELEVATEELRDKLDAVDTTNELLDDPFFGEEESTDDVDDEDFRFDRTLH